jgi:hypothetical protein
MLNILGSLMQNEKMKNEKGHGSVASRLQLTGAQT